MEKLTELPQMPDAIVEKVFNATLATPYQFVRAEVKSVGNSSPALINNRVIEALRISYQYGSLDALWFLKMGLFIPGCFDALTQTLQIPPIQIARKTIDDVARGPLPSDGELLNRIGKYSPAMTQHLESLNSLASLEDVDEGVRQTTYTKMLRSFLLFERQILSGPPLDPVLDLGTQEDSPSPSVPLIRRGIVNGMLVDVALTPERFNGSAISRLRELSSPLALYTTVLASLGGVATLTTACLISLGIIQEYEERGLPIPLVSGDSVSAVSQGNREIIGKSSETNQPLALVFNEDVKTFADLARGENHHLMFGFDLLARIVHFDPDKISLATYHVYRAWRNQIAADYWEKISSKDIAEPSYEK